MRSPFQSTLSAIAFCGTASLLACGQADLPSDADEYAEFRASVYQEPGGAFIVDGDTPLWGEQALREFFDSLQVRRTVGARQQGLIVHRVGSSDARWSDAQKGNLSYCISTAFGGNYNTIKSAMAAASAEWSQATFGAVRFVHDATQDATCNAANGNVIFDVRPVSGQSYLARAFFPNYTRDQRNVLVDSASFGSLGSITLTGILRHELGHTLGFRHEHTRPEAGTCFEDNSWRALTAYDSASVMHYPQCRGTNTGDLVLTDKDKAGAIALYPPFVASLAEVEGRWFRLTNAFFGTPRSLDTYSNAPNAPFMGNTGNYSGQAWKITSLGGGWYRLNNSFLGDGRSLDSSASSPHIAPTGAYSGQYWHLTPTGDRCFRLTNMFQGEGRALEATTTPVIAPVSSSAGQCWKLLLL